MRNQALLLEGSDPEGIHQARVACRRIRSALQTFGPVLDPAWAEALRAELGTLAADLGAVRDAEVLLMRLRSSAAQRGLEEAATDRLLRRLEDDRTRARDVAAAPGSAARSTARSWTASWPRRAARGCCRRRPTVPRSRS